MGAAIEVQELAEARAGLAAAAMDRIEPPFVTAEPARLEAVAAAEPRNAFLRVRVAGETLAGDAVEKVVKLPLGDPGAGAERLQRAGLALHTQDGRVMITGVKFGSPARKLGLDVGWEIRSVELPADRPAKEWIFIPALALLGVVVALQFARRRRVAAWSGPAGPVNPGSPR